jgi:threonine synthase
MKDTLFVSTRGNDEEVKYFSEVIMEPSAKNEGLYVPKDIPSFNVDLIRSMIHCSYKDLCYMLCKKFGVDISDSLLKEVVSVYDNFDNPIEPVPVISLKDSLSVAELYHGPTRAFKDMALQPFSKLISSLATESNTKYLVLTATSGDTGPAALAAFRNLPNTKVVCLYPENGTSSIQRKQMVKENGENLKVFGVKGDFDDTQSVVKSMINSSSFKEKLEEQGYNLSAANSVNFGRIMFQIVYHFWSYYELVRQKKITFGDEIKVIIPSGNFGNGLSAFYAKELGLPIDKIILASNENNVLSDFIITGRYDLRFRELEPTNSPAMDILISSNIERLLFHYFGAKETNNLMHCLKEKKYFELDKSQQSMLQKDFSSSYANDDQVINAIRDVFYKYRYTIDPHTATAFVVYDNLNIKDNTIISSTAEWTKFIETMADVHMCMSDLNKIADILNIDEIPETISDLFNKDDVHDEIIYTDQIRERVLDFV